MRRFRPSPSVLAGALLTVSLLLLPAAGASQWVQFVDETASRLRIRPPVDGTGDPRFDDQEKDVAVADLNLDGRDDVVVVRKRPFSSPGARQDLLLMNVGGRLVDLTPRLAPGFLATLTDARDVFIGDFTGDGWPDVVIANTFGEQPRFYRNAATDGAGAWLGLVDESALRLPFIDVPGDVNALQICAVWGGDVTGDGALDLYLANYREAGGTRDLLLVNDGAGFFTNQTDARLGELANVAFGTSVEIHDVDRDGDQDIVKISALYPAPPFEVGQYVLFNDGTGLFTKFQALDSSSPYMFTVADFNGDGWLDQYLEGDFQDRVLVAQGALQDVQVAYRTFPLETSPRTRQLGGNTKAADVDGDGDPDVGVGPIDVDIGNCGFSSDFALLRNDAGRLSDPWPGSDDQVFHVDPHDFGFLDIDGDGCLDLFMGLCDGWRVFVQECS